MSWRGFLYMALGAIAGLGGLRGIRVATALAAQTPSSSRWAEFVEADLPFFSSVVDARLSSGSWMSNNLTPRGLVLNLSNDCWACFDLDLLRVTAVWRGGAVSPVSMSQGSYHRAGWKAPEGQDQLPKPLGLLWLANGIYPGWQPIARAEEAISWTDPREPAPDPTEVGRGALPAKFGRFKAVRSVASGGICLEYDAAGGMVREWFRSIRSGEEVWVERRLRCEPCVQDRVLAVGLMSLADVPGMDPGFNVWLAARRLPEGLRLKTLEHGLRVVRVPRSTAPIEFSLRIGRRGTEAPLPEWEPAPQATPATARWKYSLGTRGQSGTATQHCAVDNITLPLDNPWRRNVRLADLAFFQDGGAAAVTFDGDVWRVDGLSGDLSSVRWRRFASGLHEPLSLVIRNQEIVVFDRNGLWRLRDTNNDGEADVHELVSNAFAQTAETREFATSMRLAPDGSFVLAKGGQQGSTIGRHNGTVLRLPADGSDASVLAYGLRMPFIEVHPRTGLITASDQQGHYIPATPLHIIRDGQYYGFLSLILPKEQYPAPIADPLTWIPHPVNPSGVSQVWLEGTQMGPLNGALLHLGYFRPEIFLVRLNEVGSRPQAAVMSLTRDLAFPPLHGAVNPVDGQLYVIGFQIWGSEARQLSGLARVRYAGGVFTLPREIVPMREGVLLRFDVVLGKESALNPVNYSAERWNYRRTAAYGSPHFKLDGSKGQDALTPSSAYVSEDGRSVFVGLPGMEPVMQMRLGWSLQTREGARFSHSAYFTPYELPSFDPVKAGFGPLVVDLNPRPAVIQAESPITPEEGRLVADLMGCVACHSIDGTTLGKVGPTWKGLFGSDRTFADGTRAKADESYLRQSIREPAARVVAGFDKSDAGMPSYEGVLSDAQIEALVRYLMTIK